MRSGIHTFPPALAALGAIIFSALPAQAAKVPASRSNDLFIGIRSTENPGSNFSYLVKIGTYNTFRDVSEGSSITVATLDIGTPSSPQVVNIGALGADLSGTTGLGQGFGPDWFNREDVQWGIFGWGSINNPVLYASRQRPSTAVASSPWDELNLTQRSNTQLQISTVLTSEAAGQTGYDSLDATANSLVAAFQPAGQGTYKSKVESSPDFGTTSGWASIEANFANGPENALLDLYRIGPVSPTIPTVLRVGYFSISSSGVITFTKPSSTTPPDPGADDDGDGFTNGQETTAGTNPNDSSDFFNVNSVARVSGNSEIAFKPVAGRTYTLRYSENLQDGWIDVEVWPAGATPPALHTFIDTDAARKAKPKGFYRLVVSQP